MMDAKSLDINVVLSCRVLKQLILYKINMLSFETQFTNSQTYTCYMQTQVVCIFISKVFSF